MLHFLPFNLKENSQVLCSRVVITLKPFHFVQSLLSLDSLVPHSFIFKAFVQWEMTRAELFLKKGFEVCLLNKVFAVIIRLHIKVQTHLMLEVTANCYHLMALWAELSQTTRHALKARFLGITLGDLKRLGNTACTFPRVASWVINLTVRALWPWAVGVILIPSSFDVVVVVATFVPLEFSLFISHTSICLWGPEKPWWVVVRPGCHFVDSHHSKIHLKSWVF